MYGSPDVPISKRFPVPETMEAWILGAPDELVRTHKPTPMPRRAEVLVRIDAVAICATDLEIISELPTALEYARKRTDDAVKVVVTTRGVAAAPWGRLPHHVQS